MRRRGPAPGDRYERLNPGAKAKRRALAQMSVSTLRDYAEDVYWGEAKAGRLPHAKAISALSHHTGILLKYGTFGRGIPEIAEHTGIATRTVIRASKDVRERHLPGVPNKRSALLWRVKRGRKGEGVTVWNVGHAMVDAIWAAREKGRRRHAAAERRKADQAELQAAIRESLQRNGSSTQCDSKPQVAAHGRPVRGGGAGSGSQPAAGSGSAARNAQPKPDIPDKPATYRPWRDRQAEFLSVGT